MKTQHVTVSDMLELRRRYYNDHVTPETAEALLCHVTGKSRSWLLAHQDTVLEPSSSEQYEALIERASQGEPLAYLINKQSFGNLDLYVTPDVLIPRPETEMLVELVLARTDNHTMIVDVGTGSGAIAVSVACRSEATIIATDISREALEVARYNARNYTIEKRIRFVQCNLLEFIKGPLDIIVANLPYIDARTLDGLGVIRWEPRVALDGGEKGLFLLENLIEQAASRLSPKGVLALEIGYDQGTDVCALCHAFFPDARIELHQDFGGMDRVVTVTRREPWS